MTNMCSHRIAKSSTCTLVAPCYKRRTEHLLAIMVFNSNVAAAIYIYILQFMMILLRGIHGCKMIVIIYCCDYYNIIKSKIYIVCNDYTTLIYTIPLEYKETALAYK
jgi:hypothetical protein